MICSLALELHDPFSSWVGNSESSNFGNDPFYIYNNSASLSSNPFCIFSLSIFGQVMCIEIILFKDNIQICFTTSIVQATTWHRSWCWSPDLGVPRYSGCNLFRHWIMKKFWERSWGGGCRGRMMGGFRFRTVSTYPSYKGSISMLPQMTQPCQMRNKASACLVSGYSRVSCDAKL